jgi:hypothetical protein
VDGDLVLVSELLGGQHIVKTFSMPTITHNTRWLGKFRVSPLALFGCNFFLLALTWVGRSSSAEKVPVERINNATCITDAFLFQLFAVLASFAQLVSLFLVLGCISA